MMHIHIKKLAPMFLTRDRGREAYDNLAQLEYDTLTIDLNSIQLLSYSFLDEIVINAAKVDKLKDIIFKTDDDYVLDDLAHIAGTRHVDIAINNPTLKIQYIQPLSFIRQTAVFAGERAKQLPTDEEDQTDADNQSDIED